MKESEIVQQINQLDVKLRHIVRAFGVFNNDAEVPESLKSEKFEMEREILKLRQQLAALSVTTSEALPIGQMSNSVFVIMPFRDPFNEYYEKIIKRALQDINYQISRSDEIYSPTSFIQTIWKSIVNAKLVIAEMTDMNPNVLYELGLCHAINKTVIMISQSMDHVPTDLRHINSIIYSTKKANWAESLAESIQRMVLHVAQNPDRQSYLNPPASVDNAIFLESILRERDHAQRENSRLIREVLAYQKSVSEIIARKNEVELINTSLLKSDRPHTLAGFVDHDTGHTFYIYPVRGTGLNIEMVRVSAGKFLHGFGDQRDSVELDSFYISRHSITNRQYAAFLNICGNRNEGGALWINLEGASPADRCRISMIGGRFVVEDGYDDFPVTYVNYYGANAFCQWADGELPTEAQWEKATRGVDGRGYPWGNEPPTPVLANCEESGWARDVAPVSVYRNKPGTSPFGVIQAIGNVWHWTSTHYPDREAQAVRGGSFFDFRLGHRSVYRFVVHPDGPDFSQGFLFCKRFLPTIVEKGEHNGTDNSSAA